MRAAARAAPSAAPVAVRPPGRAGRAVAAGVLLAALLLPAAAARQPDKPATNDFLLRAPAAEIDAIVRRQGLEVVAEVAPAAAPGGTGLFLVRAPLSAPPELVIADVEALEPAAAGIEEVFLAALPETCDGPDLEQSSDAILAALEDPTEVAFGRGTDGSLRRVWSGFVDQPAARLLELEAIHATYQGSGIVAVIDSGVDPGHPLLADRLLPGYDFTRDRGGDASEWHDLEDPSSAAILTQSTTAILTAPEVVRLNQSTSAVLTAEQTAALDPGALPPAFGHGTMVAGIVHLVAPEARILPLKAFDAAGRGSLFDVVRAIYYAVDRGANVINLSFSLGPFSAELMRAVSYATRSGVTCVAAAGNDGDQVLVFPAALGNAIGVAASRLDDTLSRFSNYGSDLVTVAAPGENLVTAYPGGGWAVASGTSFAAPWISGAVALFADKNGRGGGPGPADYYLAAAALSHARPLAGADGERAGHGRADLRTALAELRDGLSDALPAGEYAIVVGFEGGCTVAYPPLPGGGGCGVRGASQLAFAGKRVEWQITNSGGATLRIASIALRWPADNGDLKKIQLGGPVIFDEPRQPPAAAVAGGWTGRPEQRELGAATAAVLRFEFRSAAVPN